MGGRKEEGGERGERDAQRRRPYLSFVDSQQRAIDRSRIGVDRMCVRWVDRAVEEAAVDGRTQIPKGLTHQQSKGRGEGRELQQLLLRLLLDAGRAEAQQAAACACALEIFRADFSLARLAPMHLNTSGWDRFDRGTGLGHCPRLDRCRGRLVGRSLARSNGVGESQRPAHVRLRRRSFVVHSVCERMGFPMGFSVGSGRHWAAQMRPNQTTARLRATSRR